MGKKLFWLSTSLTCQYDSESSFIVQLRSVVKTGHKSPQKELFRPFLGPKNWNNSNLRLFKIIFRLSNFKFLNPKNKGRVSKILKIGLLEAEITKFDF